MFLLPRVSFRCRRFRCSHETAIELKVLLANEKLMFHSYLLERMDRIAHCAQEGKVEDGRQAGITTGTRRNAVWALNKDRTLHRGERDSAHVFRMAAPSPNESLESGTKVSATKFLSTEP